MFWANNIEEIQVNGNYFDEKVNSSAEVTVCGIITKLDENYKHHGEIKEKYNLWGSKINFKENY